MILLFFFVLRLIINFLLAFSFSNYKIAMYSCGFLLLGVTFLKCKTMATYALLVLAIGSNGTGYSGHLVNAIELSPNFAGLILANFQKCHSNISCITKVLIAYSF